MLSSLLAYRYAQNSIHSLISLSGNLLQKQEDLEEEITMFYKGLLGTAADQILAIKPRIVKDRPLLQSEHQLILIKPVTTTEIHDALCGIGDTKTSGCDGMNATS